MGAFITVLITLMPFFAMVPLAIGGIMVVALIVSPRVRDAFAEWLRRRLRLEPREQSAIQREAVADLRGEVVQLQQRIDFLERVLVESPRTRADALAKPVQD